jgi:hypothetical protein
MRRGVIKVRKEKKEENEKLMVLKNKESDLFWK